MPIISAALNSVLPPEPKNLSVSLFPMLTF